MEKNYIERVEVSVAEVLLLKKELHMYRETIGEVYEPDTKVEEEFENVLKELQEMKKEWETWPQSCDWSVEMTERQCSQCSVDSVGSQSSVGSLDSIRSQSSVGSVDSIGSQSLEDEGLYDENQELTVAQSFKMVNSEEIASVQEEELRPETVKERCRSPKKKGKNLSWWKRFKKCFVCGLSHMEMEE